MTVQIGWIGFITEEELKQGFITDFVFFHRLLQPFPQIDPAGFGDVVSIFFLIS